MCNCKYVQKSGNPNSNTQNTDFSSGLTCSVIKTKFHFLVAKIFMSEFFVLSIFKGVISTKFGRRFTLSCIAIDSPLDMLARSFEIDFSTSKRVF